MGNTSARRNLSGIAWGLFFIGLGVVMLLGQLGWFDGNVMRHVWPIWPGLFGVAQLVSARTAKSVGDGLFMIGLSGYLFVSNEGLWGLGWSSSWPLILVVIGVAELAKVLASRWLPSKATEGEEDSNA
jgi:hypothetical protein